MFGLFKKNRKPSASAPAAAPQVRTWQTPGGLYHNYSKMIMEAEAHTMIAGNTRSGKSTFLHSIMGDALKLYAPCRVQFVLIDPKRVELRRYKDLPHTIGYANDEDGAMNLLYWIEQIMMDRYAEMESAPVSAETPKYDGSRICVVIDELMPLMTGARKNEFTRLSMRLLSQSGAANIWFLVGTQAPRRDVIPGTLMLYFTLVFGLSMSSAIESRCAIGIKGCEELPLHGKALVKYGAERMTATLYPVDLCEVQELIDYWRSPAAIVA